MAIFITAAIPILCSEKPTRRMLIILVIIAVGIYMLPVVYDKMVALNALKYDRSRIC